MDWMYDSHWQSDEDMPANNPTQPTQQSGVQQVQELATQQSIDHQADEISPPPSKQKKDKAPPLPFRIYVKNRGRSEIIIEYLVKISKKARILELKRRHLKITVLTSNTPYPSRKIRRIYACTSLKTTKDQGSIRRSGGKKEPEPLVLMYTEEDSDRYIAQCFVNGLYASDGEINLEKNDNLISNNYAVKLCLEYEVRKGKKLVKKELMVLLRGEIYFVHPTLTLFLLSSDEEKNPYLDDLEMLLDFDFDEAPQTETDLPPLVCKMGKGSRNKKKVMENIMYFNNGTRPSTSIRIPLTQEEAEKRALARNISMRYEILEEVRTIIETLAYSDKYRKLLDEIWADKVRLDGIVKPEEERVTVKVKGKMLKEKRDPRAFLFPIRLEGRINENTLADTGSDTNTMPYRIYEQLGRDDIMKENRNIIMINYTEAEVTDAPIVVGRGFLDTIGGNIDIPNRTFTTFDGLTRQTFRAARSEKIRIAESDSDDKEDYVIKRNEMGTPIHNSRPIGYQNNTNPAENMTLSTLDSVINPFRKISVWKKAISFLGSLPAKLRDVEWKPDYKMCYSNPKLATGQWKTEIRLTDPYGNIYMQDFVTKPMKRKLSNDNGEENDEKIQDETCLVAQAPNEVCFKSSYFSDENSSIADLTLDNEYDKLCKMSLKIITKNKRLKAIRNSLENELTELKDKLSTLDKNKGVDIDCAKCHTLKIEKEKLKEESTKLNKFEKSTHCLNEILNNQKPFGDKLGLGFNSFEASSSGTKEMKFVKAQKKLSSDGGPINIGGPLNVQVAPKINIGPPPATPGQILDEFWTHWIKEFLKGICKRVMTLGELGEVGRVDVRTYLLGGAIDSSEANGIIRDPKLEVENSRFTFDLVPLSYRSVDVADVTNGREMYVKFSKRGREQEEAIRISEMESNWVMSHLHLRKEQTIL
ncbi:hypothetical protein Tco_1058274 [Tanacetum coccineum]|uniref:Uncharacterized protein n=1 Tax=Tanacetum coccineum TaxID=301880 RepID=A0ABQ5H9M1_9ASTR